MAPEDLQEFLRQPHVGVLASLRRNGMPYTVPVWWLWHEGAFWISGTSTRVWCRQLQNDPRASLCIEATDPWTGHLGVDGTVEVLERPDFDIWPISRLLVEKYLGRNDPSNDTIVESFFANLKTEPRLLFRLKPDGSKNAIRAIDLRVYRGKRADREFQDVKRNPA
jgi:PPOX class probable F420-dependent enzyme